MAYRDYPSSFDPIIDRLKTVDITNGSSVASAAADIRRLLSERPREEVNGTGDLTLRYAKLRIGGSLQELRRLAFQARGHRAPAEFVALIGEVADQAQKARDLAPDLSSEAPVPVATATADAPWVSAIVGPGPTEGVRVSVVAVDLDDI
jgi:hypothetical protein